MTLSLPRRVRSVRLWSGLAAGVLFCGLCPERYTLLKVGLLLNSVALWIMTLSAFGGRRWVRAVCVAMAMLAAAALIFLALPSRPDDPAALRRAYVADLLSYRGTPYLWGGGNRIAIDCSGLVQRGLIDADIQQACANGNPGLARQGLALWWHNRSARALGEGYRGETRLLLTAASLDTLDDSAVVPGDLAVMADGVHVLAYTGSGTWIEADPTPMRVVLARAPRPQDPYFEQPVRIMRWRCLESSATR